MRRRFVSGKYTIPKVLISVVKILSPARADLDLGSVIITSAREVIGALITELESLQIECDAEKFAVALWILRFQKGFAAVFIFQDHRLSAIILRKTVVYQNLSPPKFFEKLVA